MDHVDGKIHPVTMELLGKASRTMQVTGHPVYAFMGNHISEKSHELLHYGADKVFIYDEPELERLKIEPYTAVFEDFIQNVKPIVYSGGCNADRWKTAGTKSGGKDAKSD